MRCDAIERELSARLDGAADRRLEPEVERHLATCPRCRRFEAGGRRIRELTRLQPAVDVPDLVPEIMDRVRGEEHPRRLSWRLPRGLPGAAAVFVAALVAGALVAGGLPGLRRPGPALATEIPQRVAAASTEVTAYRATFEIVERNFHPQVPLRRFVASIAFEAPERFQARVRDRTTYPSESWPRNHLLLSVDGDRWFSSGPTACPREALPACAPGGRHEIAVRGREPFDGDAPLPTDIVLPVRTLAGSDRVAVVGERVVAGRKAVDVSLAHRDAGPLFTFLETSGAWRPFFPTDRVVVSLDEETWFPLAYEVRPAGGLERREWAVREGLPPETRGDAIFGAEVRRFSPRPAPGFAPAEPPPATPVRDEGFRDRPLESAVREAGFDPVLPEELLGLEPYRTGIFTGGDRPADEVLLSFSRGLSWLKIRQTRSWDEPTLYGDVGPLAAPRRLPGGGVGYYEPAAGALGRRLSIHAAGIDLYVETNLPLEDLLDVAGSLPVRGRPIPEAWLVRRWPGGIVREHASVVEALDEVPSLLLPRRLPDGYRLWTIHLVEAGGATGATAYFRRPGAELEGVGIVLHQADGHDLPPPMEPDVLAVRVRGVTGRYSPTRGELEWVEEGTYRALRGGGLDLSTLLGVADSLARPEAAE